MNVHIRSHAEHGAALVVTLIVCAVLAMVVVALMQNATLDRASSQGIANQFRAKLAAESGVALAAAALANNSTNDTFVVVLNTNRQLFIGNGITNSANFSYAPLFSATTNSTNAASNVVTGGLPALTPQGLTTNFTNWVLPGGISITSPVISWVYMTSVQTNAGGQTNVVTNARFAYWVEDLSGKLDLSVVGTTDANVARRPTGTNPAEIALWSLFSPSSPRDPGNTAATNLVSMRSNLVSVASARFVSPNVTTNMLADLAVNLRHDTNEPDLIPFGFRYADEGRPKYNLNTNIGQSGLTALASIIDRNLPTFSQRSGGFPSQAYVSALAASLIDYTDTGNSPTVSEIVGTTVRGVEALPFVNERVTLFNLTGTNTQVVSGTNGVILRVLTQDFYEFWNPANVPTAPATILIVASNSMRFKLGNDEFFLSAPMAATNSNGQNVVAGVTTNQFAIPALQPNEFHVVSALAVNSTFFYQAPNPLFPAEYQGGTNFFNYRVYLNAVSPTNLFDRTLVGCYLAQNALMRPNPGNGASDRRFFGSYSGFGSQGPLNTYRTTVGDPRMMFYIADNQDQISYATGSSFGGRNFRQGIAAGSNFKEVLPNRWPDSGHSGPAGGAAGTLLPTQVPKAAATNLFIGRISDAGFLTNVTELGAVYDPIQWRDPTTLASTGYGSEPNGGQWSVLTAGAQPDARFGGGNTLRIGRAEHRRFTNEGQRAAQLLDLFAVGPTNTNGIILRQTPGRINVNTASSNVLIALAAGVNHVSDPSLQPNSTNFFPPATAFRAFAQGVTNFRSTRPFLSVNQLPSISTNGVAAQWPTNAVFGNSNSSVYGVSAWNDAAAEEWFSKIHQLATVRSRNFLIHAIGQSLATNATNTVLSSYRMAMQVHVAPVRTNGVTTNSRVEFLQTWGL